VALLRQRGRVTYRALKREFQLDDACLEDLKNELINAQRVAVDEQATVLVWTGAPPAAELRIRPQAEAERRHLTVLFCDLVGSTPLSGQLDPEDLRAVVCAYQEAAAGIEQYAGHIAQYLGDGLLVYFGYPTAHEDDARRAVHAGLGIVEAITTLNIRLTERYGIELAVRLGIHTVPVVVGMMGGGGRYEHLALGETPNIAARLEALAPPNAVVISAVTARGSPCWRSGKTCTGPTRPRWSCSGS
jgi:class 3 adenylate cyclase